MRGDGGGVVADGGRAGGDVEGHLVEDEARGKARDGDMHARPKCTMASARWCAAATSSTQHDPKVVSARTKKRTPLGASTSTLAPSLHRRVSAAATATASCSNSSGICNATRAWPPARTQAAVASSSYTSFRCADSSDISAVCLASPRVRAQRERPLRGNPLNAERTRRRKSAEVELANRGETGFSHTAVSLERAHLTIVYATRAKAHSQQISSRHRISNLTFSNPTRLVSESWRHVPATRCVPRRTRSTRLPPSLRGSCEPPRGGSRWRLFARSQRSMRDRPRAGPNFCEDGGVSVRSQRGCLGRRAKFTARSIRSSSARWEGWRARPSRGV